MRSVLLASVVAALAGMTMPAVAGTLTFDFGSLSPSNSASLNGNGVFTNNGQTTPVSFTQGGVTLTATGYGQTCYSQLEVCFMSQGYVTQKPGSFSNGSETGLGESNGTSGSLNNEINPSTFLVVDNTNAVSHGYTSGTLYLASLQAGEGAMIYGFSNANSLSAFTTYGYLPHSALLGTLVGGAATQSLTSSLDNYFVVTTTSQNSAGGNSNNVALAEEVLGTPTQVPEPLTLSLFGAGLAGLGAMRRRKKA